LQDDLEEHAEVRAVRSSARRRRGQHHEDEHEPLRLPAGLGGSICSEPERNSLEVRMGRQWNWLCAAQVTYFLETTALTGACLQLFCSRFTHSVHSPCIRCVSLL
jgi:hypothetical protein